MIIPSIIPNNIDTGIFNICIPIFTCDPPYKPKKALNIVIAKTSSIDAPANIKVGIPLLVPILFPIKFNIEGTTTAGETAAIIKPNRPPSIKENPRSLVEIKTPTGIGIKPLCRSH